MCSHSGFITAATYCVLNLLGRGTDSFATQLVQADSLVCAVKTEYLPAAHLVQSAAPANEYVPQSVQSEIREGISLWFARADERRLHQLRTAC